MRFIRGRERGQILPLFALMIVVIFGFVALAVDVSAVYAAMRSYRSAADAAALAGAQDLQRAGSRAVQAAEYAAARSRARDSLVDRLGLPAACTSLASRTVTCTFSEAGQAIYVAEIITPLSSRSSCEACDPARAVRVKVERPAYPLTFARILGFSTFRIAQTSVGTIGYARRYTVVTLRPAQSAQVGENRNIQISGGSRVVVRAGDVATNGNMEYNGSDSILEVDDGFDVDYHDRFNVGMRWSPTPVGVRLTAAVQDPGYWAALGNPRAGAPAGVTLPGDDPACADARTRVLALPNYAGIAIPAANRTTCLRPGIHAAALTIANGDLVLLLPGLHFFDGGISAKGSMLGGWEPGQPGVTLVFKEKSDQFLLITPSITGGKDLAEAVILNAGSRNLLGLPGGVEATAARGFDGEAIQTNDPDEPKPLTLVVAPTGNCDVKFPLGGNCLKNETSYDALRISGNAALYLGGVQYAPEDNVTITGNAGATGYVGQLWAWTVSYSGGVLVRQQGAETIGPGLLRLDAACTTPSTRCGT